MQLTSTQRRTATWCLIAAPAVTRNDIGRGKLPRVRSVLFVESRFLMIYLSILRLMLPTFARALTSFGVGLAEPSFQQTL